MATAFPDDGCKKCCTCPAPALRYWPRVTVTCRSKSASPSLFGFSGYRPDGNTQDNSDPEAPWNTGPVWKWKKKTLGGELFFFWNSYVEGHPDFATCGGDPSCDGGNSAPVRQTWTYSGTIERGPSGEVSNTTARTFCSWGCGSGSPESCAPPANADSVRLTGMNYIVSASLVALTVTGGGCSATPPNSYFTDGSATETLSEPDTVEDAIEREAEEDDVVPSCTAMTGAMSTTAPELTTEILVGPSRKVTLEIEVEGAPSTTYTLTVVYTNEDMDDPDTPLPETSDVVEVTTDEAGHAELELGIPQPGKRRTRTFARVVSGQYRFYFEAPKVGSGQCYRVEWVERVIEEGGVGITSVDVDAPGVFRPAISVVGGGGAGAVLVPVMAPDGSVAAIHILRPGSGFTSVPALAFSAAINGGVTAAGACTVGSDGRLATAAVTVGGDYLPQLSFADPTAEDAETATAVCTLDPRGGLAAVVVTEEGSGYEAAPELTVLPRVAGTTPATLRVHLGDETERCATWDGVLPEGYDAEDEHTWPFFGDPYFELGDPAAVIDHVRAGCVCEPCPA